MKKVAVIFGGQSPEHDVSILSGLQVISALNPELFCPLPIYISQDGQWVTDSSLLLKSNYIFSEQELKKMIHVTLSRSDSKYEFIQTNPSIFFKAKKFQFDIVLPVLHGSFGENGSLQGILETLGIPYAGMRQKACAAFMDKETTKFILKKPEVETLPYVIFKKPKSGSIISKDEIEKKISQGIGTFPYCIKATNLGSSIGVAKVNNIDEIQSMLSLIFKLDNKAIIEPYIQHLQEYSIALMLDENNEIKFSAIKSPKAHNTLRTFKDKYCKENHFNSKKYSQSIIENILETRDIDPEMDQKLKERIIFMARNIFNSMGASGAPRLDFMYDTLSKKLWFNELNPTPGSYSYFLWENSSHNILFSELLTILLNEAEKIHAQSFSMHNLIPEEAHLFPRK